MDKMAQTLGGWRSIGIGSGFTIGGIVAAVALFIEQWAADGDLRNLALGLTGLLVAVLFGGRSYQQGKKTEDLPPTN